MPYSRQIKKILRGIEQRLEDRRPTLVESCIFNTLLLVHAFIQHKSRVDIEDREMLLRFARKILRVVTISFIFLS